MALNKEWARKEPLRALSLGWEGHKPHPPRWEAVPGLSCARSDGADIKYLSLCPTACAHQRSGVFLTYWCKQGHLLAWTLPQPGLNREASEMSGLSQT